MDIALTKAALPSERIFYSSMAAIMIVVIFVGFAPSFYLRPALAPANLPVLTPLVWAHALIFTAWALLFIVQTALVAAGRRDLHRRLGMAGVPLLLGMVVVGVLAAVHSAIRASGPPIVPPLSWLAVPIFSVPAYGGLIAAALYRRGRPQAHKRLMLLAMVIMLAPALGRIPTTAGVSGMVVIPGLFVLALVLWDIRTLGRPHRATIWGGATVLASLVLPLVVWRTDGWLAFARFAVALAA